MKLASRPGEIFLAFMTNFKTIKEKEREKKKEKEEESGVIFRFWIDKNVLQRYFIIIIIIIILIIVFL